jgi:hypothetical protein
MDYAEAFDTMRNLLLVYLVAVVLLVGSMVVRRLRG